MTPEQFLVEYNKHATNPSDWLARALGNWLSAGKVRDLYEVSTYRGKKMGDFHIGQATGAPYLMLMGYAIECLLKAAIVHKNAISYWKGNEFQKSIYERDIIKHDLVELAKSAEVSLKGNQETMLRGIAEYTIWAGRYPFAKNADKAVMAFAHYKLEDGWPWDWSTLTDRHHEIGEFCSVIIDKIPNSEFFRGFFETKI
jgi:hypothetical protein